MKKYNFFVVQSPLQLLNCIEAQYRFKTDNNILIFIESGHLQTEQQMKKLLKLYEWKHIIYIKLPSTKLENIKFVFEVRRKLKYYRNNTIEHIFIGDFRGFQMLHIANYLNAKYAYLVDDGIATVNYTNYIQSKSIQKTISKFKHNVFLYKTKQIDYSLFTIYNVKDKKRVYNNYDFINTYKSTINVKEQVFFIGQPLVKLGIVNNEYYQKYLKKIVDLHCDKEFVYIMHRIDDESYIKQLSQKLGFKYYNFNNILEVEMIKATYLPSTFITFYSSGISSIHQLFRKLNYIVYKIDYAEIKYKGIKKHDIDQIYNQFEKFDIDIRML